MAFCTNICTSQRHSSGLAVHSVTRAPEDEVLLALDAELLDDVDADVLVELDDAEPLA